MTTSPQPRRLVTAERRDEDVAEASLRPQRLGEFIGQEQARANDAISALVNLGYGQPQATAAVARGGRRC
jgi:hypothetical protein